MTEYYNEKNPVKKGAATEKSQKDLQLASPPTWWLVDITLIARQVKTFLGLVTMADMYSKLFIVIIDFQTIKAHTSYLISPVVKKSQ